jgi:uncharacterized protein YbjT (DUF2867 family)
MVIAVMGASGNVGSKVADVLLREGEEVRVFQHTRDLGALRERGAEVVMGDAMNVEDMRAFFDGSVAALVLLAENLGDPAFVENRRVMSRVIADALVQSGVPHVVALSTVGAVLPDAPGPPGGLYGFERDLDGLDSNLLVLRSAAYMDNLLAAVPMIQAQKVNGSAVRADATVPMVATQDVAREAATRLALRDFSGHQVKLLLGPEDVSMEMATRLIGARLGMPELPYIQFPPEGVRGALMGAGMSEEAAGLLVDLQLALNEGRYFDGVRRTPESTTPTRLEDFLSQALPAGSGDTADAAR